MTVNEYLALITSEHADKPKFRATVALSVEVMVRIQDVFTEMISKFDIDLARGEQLDIIGKWVGISRDVSIPITGIYFSWDDDYTVGWDFGVWQGNLTPSTITTLPDDIYRTLIRSKIVANKWNGTTDQAYEIWEQVFPTINILIQDYQNMTMAIGFVGGIVDSLTLALLTGGYFQLKPEGVRIVNYFVPIDDGPLFAFDVENQYLAGWDDGSWAREITP